MFRRAASYVAHSNATVVYFVAFLGCALLAGLLCYHEMEIVKVRDALADYVQNGGHPTHPISFNQTIQSFGTGSNGMSWFLPGLAIIMTLVLLGCFALGGGDE